MRFERKILSSLLSSLANVPSRRVASRSIFLENIYHITVKNRHFKTYGCYYKLFEPLYDRYSRQTVAHKIFVSLYNPN